MQIYLLAANLLALAILLLGLGNFSGRARSWRLLPLFLLAISRPLSLLASLTLPESALALAFIGAVELWSVMCIIWVLIGPSSNLGRPAAVQVGVAGTITLSILPLMPGWPAPISLHSFLIAAIGAAFILLAGERKVRWIRLAPPLVLIVSNGLALAGLTMASWFISLLAYTFLIGSLHWESVQTYRERQRAVEKNIKETTNVSRERQRAIEIIKTISDVPNLEQTMEHIARSIAQIAHTDQAAIFTLDGDMADQIRLVTLYSLGRPFPITPSNPVTFTLDSCPPLWQALTKQQPLSFPHHSYNGLNKLYALWHERRSGPTLIQPLIAHGRPIGALVLGNPLTNHPIRESSQRLCQMLAPQLAAMIAHHRRYLEFEAQAERVIQAAESDRTEATKQPAILEAISDGVVVSNTTGRIKFINSAAEYILGKSREQLLGRPIALVYGEIDSAEAIENLLVAFSRRDQPLPTFIETEEQAIQGRLIPWRNENKEWMGIIAVFRDVTREVKVERSRNDFISALSRELRAPLTIVKGYADLSTNGDIGQYTPEQLHVQQIIQSNSTRMATVLENALQVSDENRQRILPRFEKINPTQIIAEAIQAIVPIARLNGLELLQELKADLPLLVADAGHFRKILDNLLTNACRFTPPGGQITIRARVQAERTLGGVRPHLRLSVTDNGIGIPAIDHKRIFDPFYQAKNYTPTEPQRGMGMGLAIVKDLVELHHGRVWVESTVGEGSTFHVILPLTQES